MATKIKATLSSKWATIFDAWITIEWDKWDKLNPEDIWNIYKYVFGMEILKIFLDFKQTLKKRFEDDDFVDSLLSVKWEDNAKMLLSSLADNEKETKEFLDNDIVKIIIEASNFYDFKIIINDREY